MPAILFYRKKTRKRAAIGMIIGTLTVSIVSVFSNLYLIIPFYAKLFGMTMQDIVAMCRSESSNRWIYYGIIWNCTF